MYRDAYLRNDMPGVFLVSWVISINGESSLKKFMDFMGIRQQIKEIRATNKGIKFIVPPEQFGELNFKVIDEDVILNISIDGIVLEPINHLQVLIAYKIEEEKVDE